MPSTRTRKAIAATLGLYDTEHLASNLRHAAADAFPCYSSSMAWYEHQSSILQGYANEYGLPFHVVVGVFAALSPGVTVAQNEVVMCEVFETGSTSSHPYGDAIRKAVAIAGTAHPHPLDVLRGSKVRAFYYNLRYPERPGHVTVDRHALSVVLGDKATVRDYKCLSRRGGYTLIAGVYRGVASELGVMPHELQAMTWSWYRTERVEPRYYRGGEF